MRNKRSTETIKKHLIIGGTGRTGTTLLVQFLTACGLDTGYSIEEAMTQIDAISKAGLERSLHDADAPYVVKSPWLSRQIGEVLSTGKVQIDWAIIPMRDLYDAAESRWQVYRDAANAGLEPLNHDGGPWLVTERAGQENALALEFYRFLRPLVTHQVPLIFLDFPRFALEPGYLINTLAPVLQQHGIGEDLALTSFRRVIKSEYIHTFSKEPSQHESPLSENT